MAAIAPAGMAFPNLSRFVGVKITQPLLQQAWEAPATKFALKTWAAFGGSHLLMSSDTVRPHLVNLCGSEEAYRGVYSVIQTAIVTTAAWKWHGFTQAQRGPVLVDRYMRQSGWKMTSATLRTLGVLGISESFLTAIKNPMGFNSYGETIDPTDPHSRKRKWQPFGLQRVSRHSAFLGFSLYALGMCMMARRNACDLILWGFTPIFSILGALHQERRVKREKPWSANYFKETSFLPFGAYIRGEQYGNRITTEIPPSAYSAAFCMIGAIFFFLN